MTEILKKIYDHNANDSEVEELHASYIDLRKFELQDLINNLKSSMSSYESFREEFVKQYKDLSKLEVIDRDILRVLSKDDYQARTIKGLSTDANKSEAEIIKRITYSEHLNEFLKIFPRKAKTGEVLITTKAKYEKSATFKDRFIDAFATSRVRLK